MWKEFLDIVDKKNSADVSKLRFTTRILYLLIAGEKDSENVGGKNIKNRSSIGTWGLVPVNFW